jgi:hypothetical protein
VLSVALTSLSLAPPQVALRVLFPDRYILQGFFRPSETGECLQYLGGLLCPVGCSTPQDCSSCPWSLENGVVAGCHPRHVTCRWL